jgi:hypothetical protein
MDKARWMLTFTLAGCAANVSYHDSFLWGVLKTLPFALSASLIEIYRSARQNEENLEE